MCTKSRAGCRIRMTRCRSFQPRPDYDGAAIMNTRRQFLITAPMAALAAAVACSKEPQSGAPAGSSTTSPAPAPPATAGAPPTFGTGPTSGPPVAAATFAEAEKLAQVTMTPDEREMAAATWRQTMAPLLERRAGPRKVPLDPSVSPATHWNPVLSGGAAGPARDAFARSLEDPVPLPTA